jgi:hypothetical protein
MAPAVRGSCLTIAARTRPRPRRVPSITYRAGTPGEPKLPVTEGLQLAEPELRS